MRASGPKATTRDHSARMGGSPRRTAKRPLIPKQDTLTTVWIVAGMAVLIGIAGFLLLRGQSKPVQSERKESGQPLSTESGSPETKEYGLRESAERLLQAARREQLSEFEKLLAAETTSAGLSAGSVMSILKAQAASSNIISVQERADHGIVRVDQFKDVMSPAHAECDLQFKKENGQWKLFEWRVDVSTSR